MAKKELTSAEALRLAVAKTAIAKRKELVEATLVKAKKTLSMLDKLIDIETDMYNIGKSWVNSCEEKLTITATRGANTAYRCAMLAMRDQVRFHAANSKK